MFGKQVIYLGHQHAADGIEHKGHQPQRQNHQGLPIQKILCLHFGCHRQPQQQGNEVCQYLLCGFGQAVQHTTFPDEVAEHQKANQRHTARHKQPSHHGNNDGEQDFCRFADLLFGIWHADQALFFGRHKPDDRRLDDGHQRHVRIRRHNDGPQIVGFQKVRHKDGGRPVRRTDHGNGGGIFEFKAHQSRSPQREKDAKLRRRPKNHQLGVGKQRCKINHCTNAHKQQQREQFVGNASIKQHIQRADLGAGGQHLGNSTGQRQVDENGPKAHWQQQGWLLFDRQPDQQAADPPHNHLLPLQVP